MMTAHIDAFLESAAFAVFGASTNRAKYGNKVLRCYLQHHKKVYPVNPRAQLVEGLTALHSVAELPAEVQSISIITPPALTEQIVSDAISKGVKHIWMQPGAESKAAIDMCLQHGVNVIAGGPCLLVVLGFSDAARDV